MIDHIFNHAQCPAEWHHFRKYFPDKIFRHLTVTLTWRVTTIQQRPLTQYEQKFHEFQLELNTYQSTQTPNPTHPYQYQCRPRYDNVSLPCNTNIFPKPYDSQIILRPITSTPQEPFEQRFTYSRLHHYDAHWNNLKVSTVDVTSLTPNRSAELFETIFQHQTAKYDASIPSSSTPTYPIPKTTNLNTLQLNSTNFTNSYDNS